MEAGKRNARWHITPALLLSLFGNVGIPIFGLQQIACVAGHYPPPSFQSRRAGRSWAPIEHDSEKLRGHGQFRSLE